MDNNTLMSFVTCSPFGERLEPFIQRLTDFQKKIVNKFIRELEKLEGFYFKVSLNFDFTGEPDNEFLIWTRDEHGLMNLIIHEEELVALSWIGIEKGRFLEFFGEKDDFKGIVERFLRKLD